MIGTAVNNPSVNSAGTRSLPADNTENVSVSPQPATTLTEKATNLLISRDNINDAIHNAPHTVSLTSHNMKGKTALGKLAQWFSNLFRNLKVAFAGGKLHKAEIGKQIDAFAGAAQRLTDEIQQQQNELSDRLHKVPANTQDTKAVAVFLEELSKAEAFLKNQSSKEYANDKVLQNKLEQAAKRTETLKRTLFNACCFEVYNNVRALVNNLNEDASFFKREINGALNRNEFPKELKLLLSDALRCRGAEGVKKGLETALENCRNLAKLQEAYKFKAAKPAI